MPYYIFRLSSDAQSIELIDAIDRFPAAKQRARELRKDIAAGGGSETIQMMFGEKMEDARRLVRTRHKPSAPLEEWEG